MDKLVQLQGRHIKEVDISCEDVYPFTTSNGVYMDDDHTQTLYEWSQSITGSSEIPAIQQSIASLKVEIAKLQVVDNNLSERITGVETKLSSFFEKWNEFLSLCMARDVIPGEDLTKFKV